MKSVAFRLPRTRSSRAGSTLLASMSMVFILALVAATVLSSVSSRYNSAYRSASWNEALLTAEGGVDVTLSEIFRQIPNVTISPSTGLGTGYSQPSLGLVSGLNFSATNLLSSGTVLSITPPALTHAGEGGTTQQATVALDVLPLSQLLAGGLKGTLADVTGLLSGSTDLQLLRIRSTGTVYLTGGKTASPSRLDNDLWRPSLITDRLTGNATAQPTIVRQVEVILRPVYPFEAAVVSNDTFLTDNSGTVFDSFNSTLTTASTNGLYDSLKHLTHGTVRSNAATLTLTGTVYGDINTNGANVPKDSHVTGSVNNAAYTPLPQVNAPVWPGVSAPVPVSGSTILPAGTALLPFQYQFTSITGNLHITKGLLGLGTNVEIYVVGDVTGGIEIDSGITAKVYVAGSIITDASKLQNDSKRAANLQIYGVPDTASTLPKIQIKADANLIAVIYAPAHDVILTGNNDFSGAIVANHFQTSGAMRVHYDESLAAAVGPLLRYQIASWQEIII